MSAESKTSESRASESKTSEPKAIESPEEGVIKAKVILEKVGDHVTIKGPYTKRGLRALLFSSISLAHIFTSQEEIDETLRQTGLSHADIEHLKHGKTEEISEEGRAALKSLDITDEMIDEALIKARQEAELAQAKKDEEERLKKESKINPREEIGNFLRERGLSQSLIATLLKVGLTEEFIRLLKAMGLTDEEIEELRKLWELELKEHGEVDSSASLPSSSDEYLSADGIYLKNILSKPLADALHEIVAKKPFDPVEYLAHWLLNYKICEERDRRQREFDLELLIERTRIKMQSEDEVPVLPERDQGEESMEDWNYLNYEGF